jgi:sulfatase modifying factor 1
MEGASMLRAGALLTIILSIALRTTQGESIDLGGGVTLDLVKIPAGSFEMGSPAGEAGRGPDEDLHRVTIAEEFWIGRTPVTRGQFARFVQESGYKTEAETGPSGGFGLDGTTLVQKKEFTWRNPGFPQADDHPVVIVAYDDALAFARWLARKSGRTIVLPTEVQWEYACRAGTRSRFYSGDGDADAERIAWFRKNSGNGTRPVGQKEANSFGLCDMSGHVYEWCADLYAAYVPGGGEQGPMDKPRRVLRGGSWLKDARHVRSAARARNTPGSRNADNGFRIVAGARARESAGAGEMAAPLVPSRPAPVEELPPAPEPYLPRAVASGSSCLPTVFVVVLILVVALAAILILVKWKRSSTPPPLSGSLRGVTPRIADDGFWFNTSGYSAGDLVSFTYTGRNGPLTEQFLVEPGAREQFVYTGVRPSDVVLGMMVANQMAQDAPELPPPSPTPLRTSTPTFRTDDDPPQRRPSAY